MNLWCHQHRLVDDTHPHMIAAISAVQNPACPNEFGQADVSLVHHLNLLRFTRDELGLCPFCNDNLMSEAEFIAWHDEWNEDHRNARYCAECHEEHMSVSRWGGVNIAICGGRYRPLGLHPSKVRDERGKPVDISQNPEKLAEHHEKIKYGVIWHTDGSPRPSENVEHGKQYHALVKGHPVAQ